MRIKALGAVVLALVAAVPAFGQSNSAAPVTIASYPHGAFLENLSAGPDGALIITSYADKKLLSWSGQGAPTILAELDAHPVGILSRADDIVVSAHGAPFTGGPAFVSTNRMLVLDRKGAVIRSTPAPDARFLNGLVELAPDIVLVADSIAGRIWRFTPSTGALGVWLEAPLLATMPDQKLPLPGANGLKRRGDWLYVSNSSRGALYRVRVRDAKPSGALETVATTGPLDDFTFLADGSIAATTHGAKLIRITGKGAVSTLLESGCDGCTSVATFGPAGDLIVLTTGNLLEGGAAPARILSITSPVGAGR